MKILITGGFGYLGSYCAELLNKENIEITLLGRKIPDYMKNWSEKFKVIICDICDETVSNLIDKDYYDYVIHMAATNENICRTDPRGSLDINTFGTRNMLEMCRKNNIKNFIYISTFHVYGLNENGQVLSESVQPNPLNDYGIMHYFSELYCKQYSDLYGINCIALRLSNFYSTPLFKEINRWTLVPNSFCKQIIEKGNIALKSDGNQVRNFISIIDLYNAILKIISSELSGFEIFNVGSENYFSIKELAYMTKYVYEGIFQNESVDIVYRISNNETQNNDNYSFIYDISKIRNIGYVPQNEIKSEIKNTIMLLKKVD